MKTFSLLLLLIFNQNIPLNQNMKFEQLLGKILPIVEDIIGSSFKPSVAKFEDCTLYSNWDYFNADFFWHTTRHLTLIADDDGIVESITVHFGYVIDRTFYDSFVGQYGEPDHIYIIENTVVISESYIKDENGNDVQKISKGESDLKEGTFDEKPLFMIWEKDGFYIQAYLRHEMNISEIMFSVESPPFNIKSNKKR